MTPLPRSRTCFVPSTVAESSSSGLATKGVSSVGRRVKQAHSLRKCFDHIICLCFYFDAFASAPGWVSISIFFPGVFYMHVVFAMGRTLWVWLGWALDIHCMRWGLSWFGHICTGFPLLLVFTLFLLLPMRHDWVGFERSYKSHLITDAMLRDATMTKKKTKTKKMVECSVKSMDRADGVVSSNFVCFYRSALGRGFAFGKTKRLFIFSSPCHWLMEYQSEMRERERGRKMIQIDTLTAWMACLIYQ